MDNIEQLTGIPFTKGKFKDLGTEISSINSAEMYSYSISVSFSYSQKQNTFQQKLRYLNLFAYRSFIVSCYLVPCHCQVKKDERDGRLSHRLTNNGEFVLCQKYNVFIHCSTK